MNTPIFLNLHGKDSKRTYRVNMSLVTKYFTSEDSSGTCIYGDNKTFILLASESPEEIDNLLQEKLSPTRHISPDLP